MRHWMLRSLSPWIQGTSGLELGCLYGEFTKLLVSHFQRLTVVDAAQQFLDITARTVGQPAGCKLSYKNSLFETLACDEQFDCVFLMHVLEHLMDPVAVLEKAKTFSLAEVAKSITCPFLIVHAADDTVVPVANAPKLFEAVGSRDKHLKILNADDGGHYHAQADNRQVGIDYIADWVEEHL